MSRLRSWAWTAGMWASEVKLEIGNSKFEPEGILLFGRKLAQIRGARNFETAVYLNT